MFTLAQAMLLHTHAKLAPARFEPAIPGSVSRRLIQWATWPVALRWATYDMAFCHALYLPRCHGTA
jgi:hypothetical protein